MLMFADYLRLQLAMPCDVQAQSMPPAIEIPARGELAGVILGVHDGDTLSLGYVVKAGSIRINGIDAPELHTKQGKQARDYAEGIVPLGRVLLVRLDGREKFGRILADVRLPDGSWFAERMLAAKLCKPYDGGKR